MLRSPLTPRGPRGGDPRTREVLLLFSSTDKADEWSGPGPKLGATDPGGIEVHNLAARLKCH